MGDLVGELLTGRGNSRGLVAFRQTARLCVILLAAAIFIAVWSATNFTLLPDDPATRAVKWGSFAVTVAVAVFGWRFLLKSGRHAIQRFNEALTEEERREGLEQTTAVALPQGDGIHRFVLPATSPAIGGTVVSLNIRAKTGSSIVAVVRDGLIFRNVGPEFEFKIGDELIALGDAHQTGALKDLLGVTAS